MDVNERFKNGFGIDAWESFAVGVMIFVVVLLWNDKWQRRRFEKLAAKLPGPPDYPIVGSGLEFIGSAENVLNSMTKIHRNCGLEPVKIWLGSTFSVTIIKPVDIQVILNSSKVLEKATFYNVFKYAVGEGLFTASVEKWRRNHRLIAPVFRSNQKQFLDVFNEKNQILVEKLKTVVNKTQPFDLWKFIAFNNLNILCQNSMNYDLDVQSDKANEFIEAVTKLSGWDTMRIMKPWLYSDIIYSIYINLTGKIKLYNSVKELPRKLIQEKKKVYTQQKEEKQPNMDSSTNNSGKYNKSLLDMLFELNETGARFSDSDLEDEIITFMIAGTETTAVTVCSCLLLLAMHQHIQDRVYDEIYTVFGDSDDFVTMDEVFKLTYLEQVIHETLRVYPTAPFIARQTQDDVKLISGDHVLPRGTTCLICPFITHHSPEIYTEPWSFDPENFSAENIGKRHKYSFIPFAGGPRSCVGSKYAMLSIKAQLSTILRSYSVYTSLKMSDVRLEWNFLLRQANGYPVTIRPRNRMPIPHTH